MNLSSDANNSSLVKYFAKKNLDVENIFLYGSGGIGKTTAIKDLFCYLVELAKSGAPIVPLYIDIKKIDEDVQKPIMHYIYTVYSGNDTDISAIEKLFSPNSSAAIGSYRYFILIDGYNETPIHLVDDVNREINALKACANVRLVVSSRVNKNSRVFNGFVKIEMHGFTDRQIIRFLQENLNQNIDVKKINKHLLALLRTPLYLDAFTRTYGKSLSYQELYNSKKIRRGNILDDFIFHSFKKLDPELHTGDILARFILLYFMPALAFKLYKENSYVIGDFEFADLANDIGYFRTLLGSQKSGIYIEAYKRNVDNIELICCDNLAILSRIEKGYEMHHIWRDYFTAKHIINCMNFCHVADLETPANYDIRKFTGELLREYDRKYGYSVNYDIKNDTRRCECDFEKKNNLKNWNESPIEHFMQKHYVELNKHPLAISNLINIMKTARSYHITACYNNLDLKYSDFYTPILDLKNSSFKRAKIYPPNFILGNQNGKLPNADFVDDGNILFCEFTNSFGFWNVKKSKYSKLASRSEFIHAAISKNCTKVAFVSAKNKNVLTLKDLNTEQISVLPVKTCRAITKLNFLVNSSKLASVTHNGILIFDVSDKPELCSVIKGRLMNTSPAGKEICYLKDNSIFVYNVDEGREIQIADDVAEKPTNKKIAHIYKNTYINYLYCSDDNSKVFAIYSDHSMKMFENGKTVFEKDFLKNDIWVTSVTVSADLDKIAVACAGDGIYVYDTLKNEVIKHICSEFASGIRTLTFSHDGDRLIGGGNGICVWQLSGAKEPMAVFEECPETIEKLKFAKNGKRFIAICQDKTIRLFDMAEKNCFALTDVKGIQNLNGCDFKGAEFVGNNEKRFYNRMYLNGASVDKRFTSNFIRFEP